MIKVMMVLIGVFILSGCTIVEYGKVTRCDDLGFVGVECLPAEMFDESDIPMCKQVKYEPGLSPMLATIELCKKGVPRERLIEEKKELESSPINNIFKGQYCYSVPSDSIHCTKIILKDGTEILTDCYNDLVLHMKCVNKSEVANITQT